MEIHPYKTDGPTTFSGSKKMDALSSVLGSVRISEITPFKSIKGVGVKVCSMCMHRTPDDHMIILDCPNAPKGQPKGGTVCVGCAHSRGWVCVDKDCICQAIT